MLSNNIYTYISCAISLFLITASLSAQDHCGSQTLHGIITDDSLTIADSTILCLVQKNRENYDALALANFLDKRHYLSYSKNDYEIALEYVLLQAQLWIELDSLVKYNKALFRQSLCYYRLGDMFESHRVVTESIEYASRIDDLRNYTVGHSRLAWIYARLEQYEEAIDAIKIYKANGHKVFDNKNYLRFYHNAVSSFYFQMQEFEKARIHVDSAIQIVLDNGDLEDYAIYLSNKSGYYSGKDSLVQRLALLRESYEINQKFDNKINLSENYLNFASLFLLTNDYDSSLLYLNKGLLLYEQIDNRIRTQEAYGILAEIYDSLGHYENAYEAKKKHFTLNNELFGLTEVGELFELEKELSVQKANEKIQDLENEKQLKSLQLQRQRANLIITILAFSGLLSLLYFYNYRNKQKRKIQQLLHEQKTHKEKVLLEKKALSAQMNPHFLFNSLNSIKSYIANREPRTATRYLTKFAQLMRITLSYSEQKLIPLSEEIKSLKLYTELEQFRLNDSFNFEFDLEPNLHSKTIYVPPLIIQPFVENAIWHGLASKDGSKHLKIKISQHSDRLHIIITDNGIGRKASGKVKSKTHKSLGMKITKDRLLLFEGKNEMKHENVKINDLVKPDGTSAGTEVFLNLKINRSTDEKT